MHFIGTASDLPSPHSGQRLRTRRKPIAQIVLCQGCCCGQTDRGLPAVPLDWLKPLWKSEKLNKLVQLTVSGCLGPCDLPNVCCILTPQEQAWYGRLTSREDYAVLVEWARRCRERGEILPPPQELAHLRFERWPGEEAAFSPVMQEPADIVLLTAADTELLTWSAAVAQLPEGFATTRALNLDRLRDLEVFDAYLEDVLQESRVVLLRALGGVSYWREHLEALGILARSHRIALLCLPGDDRPDGELVRVGTVSPALAESAWNYCKAGGITNATAFLQFLSDTFLGTAHGFAPPQAQPEVGIYHPDAANVLDLASWRQRFHRAERPTAAILFYRSHWITGNLAPVDALVRALEERGLNAWAGFGPNLDAILASGLLPPGLADVVLTTTSFSAGAPKPTDSHPWVAPLAALDAPILQAIFCSTSENVWASSSAGLQPRDVAMNVALPEFDGRIITTAISFKNTVAHDAALQTELVRYQPRADRVSFVAELARRWAVLRSTPANEKRVVILLANYPNKNARVGNAVGLDTPASLHGLLIALREAGYDLGPAKVFPTDGQAIIHRLIAVSQHDPEFASEPDDENAFTLSVTAEAYAADLERLPRETRDAIVNHWGGPEHSPYFRDGGLEFAGLQFGNICIAVQPSRGYDADPSAVYHSPDLPPPPAYFAFYDLLSFMLEPHAIIQLGKHGNLEWLPGKGTALSAACFPEAILGPVPVIYPFIINNPGEGAQAKRRSAAVIVDHMVPPMTRAGTYGELRELEHLLDEYATAQGLDPAKAPLIQERIAEVVASAQLLRDLEVGAELSAREWPGVLRKLDGYLCEIKEAQIRDGLHILGRLPEREALTDLLAALVAQDNGDVPGLPRALAMDLGLDFAALVSDPAAPAPTVDLPGQGPCRTCGDVVERIGDLGRRLIEMGPKCNPSPQPPPPRGEGGPDQGNTPVFLLPLSVSGRELGGGVNATQRTLDYLWNTIWPRLQLCSQEIDHILAALAGRFVPPGPSGAPTRGTADILPTGRNFYSLDVRAVPTRTAWRVGCAAAEALLARHRERTGSYPESVALVVWGTSNMRTGGDDIAQVLWLLGVRPVWDAVNRRVTGVEAVSLTELGRPRIDVMVRISGLFRDAFPNLVRLLNDTVALVAHLEEPLDRNFLRAHIARDTVNLRAGSISPEAMADAQRIASLRVFGSKPGAYGAGLLPLIDGRNWQDSADLAEVVVTWGGYAYTGAEADGADERDAFRLRLAHTEVVAQNQDNREHDIFDSDDYFQFHGGLIAAATVFGGKAPAAYLGDTSQPDRVRTRTLQEEAYRVFRSRVVNPRWLAGVMRHGYKGAVEMAATVDYLFGYDATTGIADDWMYERLAQAYLFDPTVTEFLRQANPWAERAMIERLLEAAERGLWERPDPTTLDQLRQQHGDNDTWLEGLRPEASL
jgi:cobaltochelatase CobN